MKKEDFQKIILLAGLPLVMFFVCLVASQVILPENCYLYEQRQIHFLCDGIDLKNPQPCSICNDESTTSVARIFFGLSFVFLFLPIAIQSVKERHNRPIERTKLFD